MPHFFNKKEIEMTRINCIPVEQLSNSHAMAEYRELPRIFTAILNNADTSNIPDSYRMGKGHVRFFYDKMIYLISRYNELIDVLESRGYNLSPDIYNSVLRSCESLPSSLFNDWTPNSHDRQLNLQRLRERDSNFYS